MTEPNESVINSNEHRVMVCDDDDGDEFADVVMETCDACHLASS